MWWLFALVLTAGFAKLMTIGLNRLLSTPHPQWIIPGTELTQLSFIVLYFVYAIARWGVGHVSPWLVVSSGSSIALFDIPLIALGAVGFVLLVRSAVAYQLYAPPKCQIENDSITLDFRHLPDDQPWQQTLVGPGPMRGLALLPGNEQFLIEVSTKTYQLPRLPKAWDGLSILHFSDTHFFGAVTRRYFELVCEQAAALKPDLIAFTGDLLDNLEFLDWLPETLGRLKAPLGQYFILGNHDWYRNVPEIREWFVRQEWTDLAGRSQQIRSKNGGPSIILAGDETPWMGQHPQFDSSARDDFKILLSHTPDNIAWARGQDVDLMLAGHTHGGQIRLPILGPVYSPSRFGCRYASGVFWLEPTLLYVSRGISGREPIRYQCKPELTKIVLKSGSIAT